MIITTLALGAIVLWSSIAVLELVRRDGYGRVPERTYLYYSLP